jgi:hypothetical protein
MKWTDVLSKPGVLAALGLGMAFYRLLICAAPVRMARVEIPWLAGAVTAGVIGPVLLMVGLNGMPASGASRPPSSLLSKPT